MMEGWDGWSVWMDGWMYIYRQMGAVSNGNIDGMKWTNSVQGFVLQNLGLICDEDPSKSMTHS